MLNRRIKLLAPSISFWILSIFGTTLFYGSARAENKVAIYQGSFDPLTRGHEGIIKDLLKRFNAVYIVPDRSTQYKSLTPFHLRNKLIYSTLGKLESESGTAHHALLISERKLANFENKVKKENRSRSGTDMWDVDKYIIDSDKHEKDTVFYNVVGADTLLWAGSASDARGHLNEGKLKAMKFLVVDRPFIKKSSGIETAYNGYYPGDSKLGVREVLRENGFLQTEGLIDKVNGQEVEYMKDVVAPEVDMSSTRARNCLKALETFSPLSNVSNEAQSKILKERASPIQKQVIIALESLLSKEVIQFISENREVRESYLEKGDPNGCIAGFTVVHTKAQATCETTAQPLMEDSLRGIEKVTQHCLENPH